SNYARRPFGFVARGDRRDRQRHRLRNYDGGRTHFEDIRRQTAAHDSRGVVERRRRRIVRVAGIRERTLRFLRKSKTWLRKVRRLFQHRFRHWTRARRRRVWSTPSRE